MSEARFRLHVVAGLLVVGVACGADKQESIRLGDELVAQQRYAEATEAYRRAVDTDPDDSAARAKLGSAYVLSGDPVRAADLMLGDVEVQLKAAERMLDLTRWFDVEERMAAVLLIEPDNVGATILQASAIARMSNARWILYKLAGVVTEPVRFGVMRVDLRPVVAQANEARAEALFRKALADEPDNVEALVSAASFMWVSGRPGDGEEWLRHAAERQPSHDVANFALGAYLHSVHREAEGLPFLQRAAESAGMSSRDARFAVADVLLSGSDPDDARPILTSMVNDDSEGEVSLRLALLDYRAAKPADAVRRIDALLARVPNKPSALLLKARVLHSMGNPDLRYARAAVAAEPKSAEARSLLGDMLASNGNLEGALVESLEAVKLDPASLQASLALAQIQLALGRSPEAILSARDALRQSPESRDARLMLVKALLQQRDYAAAEAAVAPLLAGYPDDPEVAIQIATIEASRGQDAAARASFIRALDRSPESADALSGLVSLDRANGPTPDTQRRVNAALALRPRDPALLMVKAQVLASTNDPAGAEAVLRHALDIDPENVKVGLALANALPSSRFEESLAVLKQLLERRPRAIEARTALAMRLDDAGRDAEAQPLYEQIVDEDPGAAVVAYRLATIYLSDPTKAAEAFDLATAAKRGLDDDPAVNDLLGQVYTLKNLTSLALPPLREAVAADPGNALYRYHLGEAYERAGNRSQARIEYARALEIDGNFPGADRVRALVEARR